MKFFFPFSLLFVLLQACTSTDVDLKKFNSEQWKSDPNGCKGLRSQEISHIEEIKDDLIGLSESQAQLIFGRPDKKSLHERMNHINTYYIEKGEKCDAPTVQPTVLILEYNGLNQLKLITVRK